MSLKCIFLFFYWLNINIIARAPTKVFTKLKVTNKYTLKGQLRSKLLEIYVSFHHYFWLANLEKFKNLKIQYLSLQEIKNNVKLEIWGDNLVLKLAFIIFLKILIN